MFDNSLTIFEKARECLTPHPERKKDHYECPICGGKLWVRGDDSKLSCVTSNCTGIYKAINDIYRGGSYEVKERKQSAPKPEGVRLPAGERDKAIKSIIQQLDIESIDRADLIERGLTDKQIRQYGFFTSKSDTRLEYPVNSDLAGITSNGAYFTAKYDAYNIPIKNVEGQYVGFKIKPRNPGEGQGKYLTAVSYPNKNRKVLAESHTAEFGCLPLQHVILFNKPGQILGFCEGELKGIITAERHGINIISASGSHFLLNNGAELKHDLEVLQPSQVILFPDAGMLENTGNIVSNYNALNHFLSNLGYDLMVADWEHGHDKSKGDCDEIPAGQYKIIPFAGSEWYKPTEKVSQQVNVKPVNKLEVIVNGKAKALTPVEPLNPVLVYSGTLTITDRLDLASYTDVIRVSGDVSLDDLANQVREYRDNFCCQCQNLKKSVLNDLAKQYGIRHKLNKQDLIQALTEKGVPCDGLKVHELRLLAVKHGIRPDMTAGEIAKRLEAMGIDKSEIDFPDYPINIILDIFEHQRDFISLGLHNKLNPASGNRKYNIALPFSLLGNENQYLDQFKARRNDPVYIVNNIDFENWKRQKNYDADIVTNQRYLTEGEFYLNNLNLNNPIVYALKSPLDTGKTTLLQDLLKIEDKHILICGYRNGLNFNTIRSLKKAGIDIKSKDEAKKKKIKPGNYLIASFCIDSYLEVTSCLPEGWQKDTIFVVDEADAVVLHGLIGSTIKENRLGILGQWRLDMTATENAILIMSGTLNNITVRFFDKFDKNVIRYENKVERKPVDLTLVIGSSVNDKAEIIDLKEKDIKAILDQIAVRVLAGEKLILSSDAQKMCEKLHEWLLDMFPELNIVRIDRPSRCGKGGKETKDLVHTILDNPMAIVGKSIDILIYNSSAESGVNIDLQDRDNPYFNHHYHFGYGVLGVDATIQMLRRYRAGIPITLWMTPTAISKEPIINNEIRQYQQQLKLQEAGHVIEDQDKELIELYELLDATLNYEKSNPRQTLIHALNQHGYNVTFIANGEGETSLEEITERIEIRSAKEIFEGADGYIGDNLYEVKLDDNATWDEHLALTKAHYFANFGYSRDDYDNDQYPLFTPENIRKIEFHNRKFFDHCRNRIYLELDRDDLKLLQRSNYQRLTFLGDIKIIVSTIDAIKESGIADLLGMENIAKDDKLFQQIKDYAIKHPKRWHILAGKVYNERMFDLQLRSILDKYLGVKLKRDKDDKVWKLETDKLIISAIPKIKETILNRVQKQKDYLAEKQQQQQSEDFEYYDYTSPPDYIEVETPAVMLEMPQEYYQPTPQPAPVVSPEPTNNNVIVVEKLEKLIMPDTSKTILWKGKTFNYYPIYSDKTGIPTWKNEDHDMISFDSPTKARDW